MIMGIVTDNAFHTPVAVFIIGNAGVGFNVGRFSTIKMAAFAKTVELGVVYVQLLRWIIPRIHELRQVEVDIMTAVAVIIILVIMGIHAPKGRKGQQVQQNCTNYKSSENQ